MIAMLLENFTKKIMLSYKPIQVVLSDFLANFLLLFLHSFRPIHPRSSYQPATVTNRIINNKGNFYNLIIYSEATYQHHGGA